MFQNRLKELRKAHGYTQTELGTMINVGKSTISQYESGTRQPDIDILVKLSQIFNCSIESMLGVSEKKSKYVAVYSVLESGDYQESDILALLDFLDRAKNKC